VGSFALPSIFGTSDEVSQPWWTRRATSTSPRTTAPPSTSSRRPARSCGRSTPEGEPDRTLLGGDRLGIPARDQPRPGHGVEPGAQHLDGGHVRYLPDHRPDRRLRHPGERRQPAPVRQRLRRDGQPGRQGPGDLRRRQHRGEQPAHRGGEPVLLPGPGRPGPRRTIYTADPLHTMEATSPAGFLQGSTNLDNSLSFGGWGFALENGTFYFQSGQPFDPSGDAISTFSLAKRHRLPRRPPVPVRQPRLGRGRDHPATANYFAPGTTPTVDATFDPCGRPWPRTRAVVLGRERRLARQRADADRHGDQPAHHGHRARLDPPHHPPGRTAPGPYEVQAVLLNTATTPATTLGTTACPTQWARPATSSTSPPCRGHRLRRTQDPAVWPSTPSSASTASAPTSW